MRKLLALFGVTLALWLCATSGARSEPEQFAYVGPEKCKMCHSTAKAGEQYRIWSEGPHAKAYAALASENAKKVAKGLGIEDPQKSEKCLKCHVPTAAVKAELKSPKWNIAEGITCEDCHGPGSAYQKMTVMKAITAGTEKGETYGLLTSGEAACKKCHNEESPTFDKTKPFNFKERYAKIAHPKPKAAQ
ncbi:MAG: cytochrome C554 [Chitinivibrionia bacterium]|nr:cytochrome C554 [Chitinivibrionia bacterium]